MTTQYVTSSQPGIIQPNVVVQPNVVYTTTAQQRPTITDRYNARAANIVAILITTFGCLSVIFGIYAIVINASLHFIGIGIWCGIGFHINEGIYHTMVQDWIKVFTRRNVFVQKSEDTQSPTHRNAALKTLFKFLDCAMDEQSQSPMRLAYGNSTRKHTPWAMFPMWNKTREMLRGFYRPYNVQLARLLNDKRFLWTP